MSGEICLIVSRSCSRICSRMARIATRQLTNIWSGRHIFREDTILCLLYLVLTLKSKDLSELPEPSWRDDNFNLFLLLVFSHGHTILTKSLRFFFVLVYSWTLASRKWTKNSDSVPLCWRAQRWVAPRFTVSAPSTSAAGYRQFRQNTDSQLCWEGNNRSLPEETSASARSLFLNAMQISRRQAAARARIAQLHWKRPASREMKKRWSIRNIIIFRKLFIKSILI